MCSRGHGHLGSEVSPGRALGAEVTWRERRQPFRHRILQAIGGVLILAGGVGVFSGERGMTLIGSAAWAMGGLVLSFDRRREQWK
jgi:hypothetical protein